MMEPADAVVIGTWPDSHAVLTCAALENHLHPANLVMGACNFHLDPTHRNPIPPARLQFLAAASGFTDIRTWELHPKEEVDLSGLRLAGVNDRIDNYGRLFREH